MSQSTKYTIEIDSDSMLEVNTLLEQIHAAARTGGLDWEDKSIKVDVSFSKTLEGQSAAPLEQVIHNQANIFGVDCHKASTPMN